MSCAQGKQGFFATQLATTRIHGELEPYLGTHGLRCEWGRPIDLMERTPSCIALDAFGHQPC